MKIGDFAYIVETKKEFDEAVISVRRAVEKKGWTILQVYDFKEILAVKGFKQKPLKIIEICSGKYANRFLNRNRFISLCMPCKINVLEENGKVKIIGMKPTVIVKFFPEANEDEAKEVEKDIIEIIESAK
jgi:uncharacterized protein (DUF302 family)